MSTTNRVHDSSIINSTDFDEMSLGAQVLYVKCVANADDFGVVEVESIFRTSSKIRRPAIREIINSGLVEVIREKGTVVYIKGFHNINSFAKHGARRSRYDAELMQNSYTKNAVSKLKIKDFGNPMIGSATSGPVQTGTAPRESRYVRFCRISEKENLPTRNADLFDALCGYYQHLDEMDADGITDSSIKTVIHRCLEFADKYCMDDVVGLIYDTVDRGKTTIYWNNLYEGSATGA